MKRHTAELKLEKLINGYSENVRHNTYFAIQRAFGDEKEISSEKYKRLKEIIECQITAEEIREEIRKGNQ